MLLNLSGCSIITIDITLLNNECYVNLHSSRIKQYPFTCPPPIPKKNPPKITKKSNNKISSNPIHTLRILIYIDAVTNQFFTALLSQLQSSVLQVYQEQQEAKPWFLMETQRVKTCSIPMETVS